MSQRPRAIVYIDGFNLYRRALSGHPELKWLDLVQLSHNLLPEYELVKVRYFSSRLKPEPFAKFGTVNRQQIYFRAIRTLAPLLSIHWGKYQSRPKKMLKYPYEVDPLTNQYLRVGVRQIEEKGSDVNLASWMLLDAHKQVTDISFVLTNDSDQVGPLLMMRNELRHDFGIIFPTSSSKSSKELLNTNPLVKINLTPDVILQSQFPKLLADENGQIFKPIEWEKSEGPITGAL